jgi:sigma-B regulation protein RsbQ
VWEVVLRGVLRANRSQFGRGWVVEHQRAPGVWIEIAGLYLSEDAAAAWIEETGEKYLSSERRRRTAVVRRNNVHIAGRGYTPIVFAHGFGCDQQMWRFVAPHFEDAFKVILFDHVGSGGSDLKAYSSEKYASLSGYAADLVEIGDVLGLREAIVVAHSVSSMIAVLASVAAPPMFSRLVPIGPSARYIDDVGYVGGFSEDRIRELLQFLESHYIEWSAAMAPAIMGNPDRPHLAKELGDSICRMDRQIAYEFARATFTSDNRADLPLVSRPSLILQCSEDAIAPVEAGAYVHSAIRDSTLTVLKATGHCPHLSAPHEVVNAIKAFA